MKKRDKSIVALLLLSACKHEDNIDRCFNVNSMNSGAVVGNILLKYRNGALSVLSSECGNFDRENMFEISKQDKEIIYKFVPEEFRKLPVRNFYISVYIEGYVKREPYGNVLIIKNLKNLERREEPSWMNK